MSKLPSISGMQAVTAFKRHGFLVCRKTSSHHIMKRAGHRFVLSVPVHAGKDLPPGTLRSLIRAAGLTVEQFLEALQS